jgi:signal transduction histidine kinase
VTLPNALLDSPGVRTEKPAPRPLAGIKQEAQALGAAQSRQAETDTLTVAGNAMDQRGIPLLRLILSAAGLIIVFFDPSEPDRHVTVTYATLAAYTLYSALLFVAASLYNRQLPKASAHWIDLAWHILLVSLSSGTNSLFFFFFFFDILIASFRGGAREGFRVTAASAILFTLAGYQFSPASEFELNRFLMRPVYLVVLGYMIACFGELELRLRRRVDLLKEVTVLSNPRFGVHQTITSALEKIRRFYDAEACLLVITGDAEVEHHLYEARRGEANRSGAPERCAPEMAAVLLSPPFSHAMLVEQQPSRWRTKPLVHVEDVTTRQKRHDLPDCSRIVFSTLDAPAVITVPFRYHHEAVGRLYVTGRRFDLSDLDFLSHAIYATLRVTDNVRLVDSLAYNAADNERQKIARGIHDTVIQPFIGLQIGLRAIVQRLRDGNTGWPPAAPYHAEADIEHLVASIDDEVARLRQYVTTLKGDRRNTFMPSIRRFAREFRRLTGIDVEVKGPVDLTVSERVSEQLFGLIAEALSNIRRHTTSIRAAIVVERVADAIEFRVENDVNDAEAAPFTPKSLGEHAEALGGKLHVRRTPVTTAVVVSIPL